MTPDNRYLGCKFGRLGPMFLWTLVSHDLAFKINRSMAVEIILYIFIQYLEILNLKIFWSMPFVVLFLVDIPKSKRLSRFRLF